jgi:hypothetical protein
MRLDRSWQMNWLTVANGQVDPGDLIDRHPGVTDPSRRFQICHAASVKADNARVRLLTLLREIRF